MTETKNPALENVLQNHFHTFLANDLQSVGHINPSPESADSVKLANDSANLTKVTMQLLQDGGFLKS
jgi:hypothetical protein